MSRQLPSQPEDEMPTKDDYYLKIDHYTWADENLEHEYPANPNAVNPNQHLLIYLKVQLPAGTTSVQGQFTKLPDGQPFSIDFLKDVPGGKAFIISHSELDPRSDYRLDFGEKFPDPQYPASSEIHTI
jgi:hypothetical protein